MSGIQQIESFWNILTEFDLRSLEQQATRGVNVAIIGDPALDRTGLADQMRCDPARPDQETDTPVLILDLAHAGQAVDSDLIIFMLDGLQAGFQREKELAHELASAGKRVLVFVVLAQIPDSSQPLTNILPWRPRYVVYGPTRDDKFLHDKFVPTMIRMGLDHILALGRDFPLFRIPIARFLINDTSNSNAAYSLATGMAEILPILNIPLVVTDTVVLTKNQAFMAYKLGLVFGYSTDWRSYTTEFGSVLGFGFLLRQFARSLIGLIPGFGIIPKVGVAYAGTIAVGNAIYQWYLTGRHVSGSQLKAFYTQAFSQGKKKAGQLFRRRQTRAKKLPAPRKKPVCPQCGRTNNREASYCQYCGAAIHPELPDTAGQ